MSLCDSIKEYKNITKLYLDLSYLIYYFFNLLIFLIISGNKIGHVGSVSLG